MSDKDANTTMKILLAAVCTAALAGAAPAWAQVDPLKSPACGEALAALQAARNAPAQAGNVPALRNLAAATCLGGASAPQRSARVLRAPEEVPPPIITPPAPPAALAVPPVQLPPPPVAIQRPPSVTHCDAGGCWADDGRGLRHLPPGVAGPAGLCTSHGGLVYCP